MSSCPKTAFRSRRRLPHGITEISAPSPTCILKLNIMLPLSPLRRAHFFCPQPGISAECRLSYEPVPAAVPQLQAFFHFRGRSSAVFPAFPQAAAPFPFNHPPFPGFLSVFIIAAGRNALTFNCKQHSGTRSLSQQGRQPGGRPKDHVSFSPEANHPLLTEGVPL